MAEYNLISPLKKEDIEKLRAGDKVNLSGVIYTARDLAHKKLYNLIEKSEKLPFSLEGQIIYYVGPSPAKEGKIIGSAGPTTSYRMDAYAPSLLEQGLKGMIGKGPRNIELRESIVDNKAIYFAAVGGAAALIAKCIKSSEIIAYEELGTEAIRRLEVENFPLIVVNDIYGNDLYEMAQKEYRII